MDWVNIVIGVFSTIVGLIGGGVGIFFWKENKRMQAAQAQAQEIQNELTHAQAWKDLAEKYEAKCEQKSAEKRELYKEIDRLRVEKRGLEKELAHEQFENEKLCWHKCTKNDCEMRQPPRDYAR